MVEYRRSIRLGKGLSCGWLFLLGLEVPHHSFKGATLAEASEAVKHVDSLIETLERAPGFVAQLVGDVPPERLHRKGIPGKWTIAQHVCHLAEVHSLFFARLERMMQVDHPTIEAYAPPDNFTTSVDTQQCVATFTHDRKTLVAHLRQLTSAQWIRTAEHSEYSRYSVFIMFRHLAMHDMFHCYRIEELLLGRD